MKLISAAIVGLALLPSAVIAMLIKDSGEIVFTKDEGKLLETRIKDQDAAVSGLRLEVDRLKAIIERYKNDSCA